MSWSGGRCSLPAQLVGVIVEVDALSFARRIQLRQSGTDGAEGGSFGLLVLPALFHQLHTEHCNILHVLPTLIVPASLVLMFFCDLDDHSACTHYITMH